MTAITTAAFRPRRRQWTARLAGALFLLTGLAVGGADDSSPLAFYDPGATGPEKVAAPAGPVTVTVRPDRVMLRIPSRFYGLNIHPEPAAIAFSSPQLLRDLAPDSIRIMAARRTCWFRNHGRSVREDHSLSPLPGVFNWTELDALVRDIRAIGAEPYVALGFGAPPWLNTSGSPRFNRPLTADLDAYAEFMAAVVKHLNVDRRFGVPWFTIDNEPENVRYPLSDYIRLARSASRAIRAVDPAVGIAGPVTGYARWEQPDGVKLGFAASLSKLKAAGLRYDAIDWHIYSAAPGLVFKTVEIVRGAWPETGKLIVSELNRDWRYTGVGGQISEQRNTGWESVSWLAAVYDGLQRQGVFMTHYFCWKANAFGMVDYYGRELRPSYYVFRLFTGSLGRERLESVSGHPAVGCIATRRDGRPAVLLYNRSERAVEVHLQGIALTGAKVTALSREWYEAHRQPVRGRAPQPPENAVPDRGTVTVPALGLAVVTAR